MNAARAIRLDIDHTETSTPTWDRVDDPTAGLLTFLSFGADAQWDAFMGAVRALARKHRGRVDPNLLRPLLTEAGIHPKRVGAFYRKALCAGVLTTRPGRFVISLDLRSRNRGKPVRLYIYDGKADHDIPPPRGPRPNELLRVVR